MAEMLTTYLQRRFTTVSARKLVVSFLGNLFCVELPNGNNWLIICRVFILLTQWQATAAEPGVRGAVLTAAVACL